MRWHRPWLVCPSGGGSVVYCLLVALLSIHTWRTASGWCLLCGVASQYCLFFAKTYGTFRFRTKRKMQRKHSTRRTRHLFSDHYDNGGIITYKNIQIQNGDQTRQRPFWNQQQTGYYSLWLDEIRNLVTCSVYPSADWPKLSHVLRSPTIHRREQWQLLA